MFSLDFLRRSLAKPVAADWTTKSVSDPDELFLRDRAAGIKGWLFEPAGMLTIHLIRSLPDLGKDALLEIGVFEGRYISLLHHAGAKPERRIIGIDTYEWVPEKKVQENLLAVSGADHGIELVRGNSQDIKPAALKAMTDNTPIRFVSIDGDHSAGAVHCDLELIEAVLSDDGIVAVDDFMNPLAVGVTEGLGTFYASSPRKLAPFAYAANKLFLCRPPLHAQYADAARDLVKNRTDLRTLDATRDFWQLPEPYYNQMLFGSRCVIMSRGIYG